MKTVSLRWRALISILLYLAVLASLSGTALAEESGAEFIDLVIELLGDKDPDMRALAFEQIRTEAPGEAATRRFALQLQNLSPAGTVGLLRALAARGDAAARPALVDVLDNSPHEPVRVAAIAALGALGIPGDCARLVEQLGQGAAAEQQAARMSLVRLRGDSVAALIITAMAKAPASTRIALIEILATRRDSGAIPDLLNTALDGNAQVRRAAMVALAALAGPEHIPGMVRGVLQAEKGSERAAAEKAILPVCGRIEDRQRRADPLLAAIGNLEKQEQTMMLSTIGRIGGTAALQVVEAAMSEREGAARSAGIRALCNWPDASVAPQLIDLAKNDPQADHRKMALRALIRIAPLADGRSDAQKLMLLKAAMALSQADAERNYVLQRAAAIRIPDALRFIVPYLHQPPYAQQACKSVVELAHHRHLREPNEEEFHHALDWVIQTSRNPTVIDRANRYKKDQTWVRP